MHPEIETLVQSIAICHSAWKMAFDKDCNELCDELSKLKMNFFRDYRHLGGKAAQIGDLVSYKGEIRWKPEDEYANG